MFQISIFIRLINYFKLMMALLLPFFPGEEDPSGGIVDTENIL